MRKKTLGFTLVELVITLALVVVLLVFGVPAMRDLLLNNRQTTHINEMLIALNMARAEAVKRGSDVVVCISDGAAVPDCNGSATQWEDGWIVFVDGNQAGASDGALDDPADLDGNGLWDQGEDGLLRVHAALSDGNTLRGNTNVTRDVIYNARGFSGSTGTLRLCDSRGAPEARGIIINNTGRPRLATDSNGDGTVDDGAATPTNLTCP